jgi:hypothetical protein
VGTASAGENGFWSVDLRNVAEGAHVYRARAADEVGNISVASEALIVVVDRQAPETFVESSLKNLTNETMAAFGFSSNEQYTSFECSLDGGPFEACKAPKRYDRLSDGQHVFKVRATDAAGNADPNPARRRWAVDATAPTVIKVTPLGKKVSPKTVVRATFSEPMNEASVEALGTFTLKKGTTTIAARVDYDPATRKATLNPTKKHRSGATYTATMTISAKDLAGNALAANKVWRIRIR